MIKLLRGQAEGIEREGVKLTLSVISTAQQARLMDLSGDNSINGQMKVTAYYLRNCIEPTKVGTVEKRVIEIGGEEYDTAVLIESADLSDKETIKVMLCIRKMCDELAFVNTEQVKKPKA